MFPMGVVKAVAVVGTKKRGFSRKVRRKLLLRFSQNIEPNIQPKAQFVNANSDGGHNKAEKNAAYDEDAEINNLVSERCSRYLPPVSLRRQHLCGELL
jgi:hypothetical protein